MSKNRYKIIEGPQVRSQNLLTPKGKAIYNVALHHPCVTDLTCVRSTQGDDVIQMTLLLEVPDNPLYPILERPIQKYHLSVYIMIIKVIC